tara:strand:+ start:13889 stop:14860 length:972 start_codon:yes stop_codon:yes gene_type:complete
MTRPRNTIVSLDATPYYHVMSRCVRQSYLCGYQKLTNRDYSHRKQWFVDRLYQLQSIFAVDIAAYAIMSNHYHLVVHIDAQATKEWSNDEVIRRWTQLYYGPHVIQRYQKGACLTPSEHKAISLIAAQWRERLMDLSWFMRCLNEHIARLANAEDNCTGRFWEGRFKSVALLDEKAILSCMAYVDLNPMRANTAKTPETSSYTSVQLRLEARKTATESQPAILLPFVNKQVLKGLYFSLREYLELVEWTGQHLIHKKKEAVAAQLPYLLKRLNIKPLNWVKLSKQFEATFKVFAGSFSMLKKVKSLLQIKRMPGISASRKYFD